MKIIRVKSDMHSFIANTFWLRNYRKISLHKWPQTKMFSISDDTIFWLLGISCPFTRCDLLCSLLAPLTKLCWLKLSRSLSLEASIYMIFRANTPNKMDNTL